MVFQSVAAVCHWRRGAGRDVDTTKRCRHHSVGLFEQQNATFKRCFDRDVRFSSIPDEWTVTLAGGHKRQEINARQRAQLGSQFWMHCRKYEQNNNMWQQMIHRKYFYHLTVSRRWKRHILINGSRLWVALQLSYKRQESQLVNKHLQSNESGIYPRTEEA